MGRHTLHDSDDDRRRSRKERDRKSRRSRSKSRSRGRSPPRNKKREHGRSRHNTRSRSKERRRQSRERYRETKGGRRDTRHRSSSKSRRDRYSNSKSRSRSRSRGRRSRSSSIDRERKRQKDKNERGNSSKLSSKSKTSVKYGDFQNDDAGIKNSKLSIPSAEDLAKIESDSFVAEIFVSQKSEKPGESEDTINSHQKQSHEDAIFGVSGRQPLKTNASNNEPNKIPCERRTEGSGIMASLLHEREESKNDRWIKKLHSMRQKTLQGNLEPLLQ